MSKQRVTARMEGIRKRWTGEVKEDLKIIGIGVCYTVARDGRSGGGFYWIPRSTTERRGIIVIII